MELSDYSTIAIIINLVISVPLALIASASERNPLPILYAIITNVCAFVAFATGATIALCFTGFSQFLCFFVIAPMVVAMGFGLCSVCPLLMPLALLTVINFIVAYVFF